MTKFKADQFTATKWDSQEDKAEFANWLVRFVRSGFKRTLFYRHRYQRLSMMFGHIAHYNADGFYSEWFGEHNGGSRFLNNILRWGCYGSPEYTYSDVEKVLQAWVRSGCK